MMDLGAGSLQGKRASSANQGPDGFLGFRIRMRLKSGPAQGTSGLCLPSAALPAQRDHLGEGMRKTKQGLIFPFTSRCCGLCRVGQVLSVKGRSRKWSGLSDQQGETFVY